MKHPVFAISGVVGGVATFRWLRDAVKANGRECHIYSAPGFDGRSVVPELTPKDLAFEVQHDMDAIYADKVHLIAHCGGGPISLHLARLLPGRIASITFIGSYFDPPTPDWLGKFDELESLGLDGFARARIHMVVEDPALHERTVQAYLDTLASGLEAARSIERFLSKYSHRSQLFECEVPKAFVVGLADKMVAPAYQINYGSKAGAKIFALEGIGHSAHMEAPERVAKFGEHFWTAVET